MSVEYGGASLSILEGGNGVVDADSLNACATKLQPGTASVLATRTGPYEGMTVLPPMVRRREGEVTYRVSGKTMPLG